MKYLLYKSNRARKSTAGTAALVVAAVALSSGVAKLLNGRVYYDLSGGPGSAHVQRLTWAGHEFLDNARNDRVWNKVTSTIKNAATTASFEVLVEMLKVGVKSCIGMPE